MRLMGKRQLGQLQPTELVITILLSEIAAAPLESNDTPLINSLFAAGLLVCLEIINSVINLKSPAIRRILQGKPAVIIKNGILDQKKLKDLRFSTDDILEQMRQKDVFDIGEVAYAVVETNGTLNLKKKSIFEPLTSGQYGIKSEEQSIPVLVINDGELIKNSFRDQSVTIEQVNSVLKSENVKVEEILILLIKDANNYTLIKKEKK